MCECMVTLYPRSRATSPVTKCVEFPIPYLSNIYSYVRYHSHYSFWHRSAFLVHLNQQVGTGFLCRDQYLNLMPPFSFIGPVLASLWSLFWLSFNNKNQPPAIVMYLTSYPPASASASTKQYTHRSKSTAPHRVVAPASVDIDAHKQCLVLFSSSSLSRVSVINSTSWYHITYHRQHR